MSKPTTIRVCHVDDLSPGERRIVQVGNRSIGVFNVAGKYYALLNRCPHEGAELCRGKITGTTRPGAVGEYCWEREGEIIRCPWHGWEFDITTGRSVFNPNRVRVRTYEVEVVEPDGDADSKADSDVETFTISIDSGMVTLVL